MVKTLVVPVAIEDLVNEAFRGIGEGKEYVITDWDLDRVYVEMEGQSYSIRMWNIDEYEIRWTLFVDIPDSDGGSHGEPINEGVSNYDSSEDERQVTFNMSEWKEEMQESKFVSLVLNFLKDEIIECNDASEESVTVDLRNCNYYVNGRPWEKTLENVLIENGFEFSLGGGDGHGTTVYNKNLVSHI